MFNMHEISSDLLIISYELMNYPLFLFKDIRLTSSGFSEAFRLRERRRK